jgi:hypothetical protein
LRYNARYDIMRLKNSEGGFLMVRFFILKDGKLEATTSTKEKAFELVKLYQADERKKHQWLHSHFMVIEGKEVEQ